MELLRDTAAWFADRDIECNLARDIDAQLASQGGEAVAWRVTGRDGLTVTAQYPAWAETDCLLTITPLYTHPADQVAERNAELVELLRGARAGLDNVGLLDSYIDYDAVSAISTRIDAKLASLKGVEE